jgi:hypothetical protein
MRIEGFDIPDGEAAELLTAFGADPVLSSTDPNYLAGALRLILRFALDEQLKVVRDPVLADEVNISAIEDEMLRLAGSARGVESGIDRRGVPTTVWTDESGEWVAIGDAPRGYDELEGHISSLTDLLLRRPELRLVASTRLLPTNESFNEVMVADVRSPVIIRTRLDGRPHNLRFEPEGLIVIGILGGKPEEVRETRR